MVTYQVSTVICGNISVMVPHITIINLNSI